MGIALVTTVLVQQVEILSLIINKYSSGNLPLCDVADGTQISTGLLTPPPVFVAGCKQRATDTVVLCSKEVFGDN